MKLLKDLLYTRGNVSLDIARLCTLISVLAYWAGVFITLYRTGRFEPVSVGAGCAGIFGAAAAWIHVRQRHEGAATSTPPELEGESK
jgi:hypothetical protein